MKKERKDNKDLTHLLTTGQYSKVISLVSQMMKVVKPSSALWGSKAFALHQTGQFSKALDAYNESLKLNPSDTNALNLKANLLVELKQIDEALRLNNKAMELLPNNDAIITVKGNIYRSLNRFTDAISQYKRALEINPENPDAKREKKKAEYYQRLDNINDICEIINLFKNKEEQLKALDAKVDILFSQRKYDDALTAINIGLQMKPNSSEFLTKKVNYFIKCGQDSEALNLANKALKVDKNSSFIWEQKGFLLMRNGQNKEALKAFNKSTKITDTSEKCWQYKGEALVKLERGHEAITAFDKALRFNPMNSVCLNKKANTLLKIKRYEPAIEAFEKAIEHDPGNIELWQNKGCAFHYLEQYENALEAYSEALEINDQDLLTLQLQGESFSRLKRFDEAIESYKKSIKIAPNLETAYKLKGEAFIEQGKFKPAISAFDQAIKLNPKDSHTWFAKAVALKNMNHHKEAAIAFDHVIKLDIKHEDAWRLKAACLFKLEAYEETLKVYNHLVAAYPKKALYAEQQGIALFMLKRYEQTIKVLTPIVKKKPGHYLCVEALGESLDMTGQSTEALKTFSNSIKVLPRQASLWVGRGKVYYSMKRFEDALINFNRSIEIDPSKDFYWLYKGETHINLVQPDEALEAAEKALELDDKMIHNWNLKARAYQLKDDYKEALKYYRKGLELDQKNKESLSIIKKLKDIVSGKVPAPPKTKGNEVVEEKNNSVDSFPNSGPITPKEIETYKLEESKLDSFEIDLKKLMLQSCSRKIFIANNFLANVPRMAKPQVLKRIEKFISIMIASDFDYHKIPSGFFCKRFHTKGKSVYTFRVNRGDRIIFMYSSDIANLRDDSHSIVIIEYSNHDSQNRIAEKRSIHSNQMSGEDFFNISENYIKSNPEKFDYNIEEKKTIEIPVTDYVKNSDLDVILNNKDLMQYLNNQQYRIFNKNNEAIILSGSAGCGKTLLGLNKMLRMKESDCLYITYTTKLKQKAENLLQENNTHIKIHDINTFLINKLDKNYKKFVTFNEFNKWYSSKFEKLFRSYNAMDVWSEIRGTVKGSLLIDAERISKNSFGKTISQKQYLELSKDFSDFENKDKKNIYEITTKYNKWLKSKKLFDENDLAFLLINSKLKSEFDYMVIDEAQDLTELQIFALMKLVKDYTKLMISGDSHQIINPTHFDFGRIKNVYNTIKQNNPGINYYYEHLSYNYRSAKEIVTYINTLSTLRRDAIGHRKQAEETIEKAISEIHGENLTISPNQKNLTTLISVAKSNPYCVILVGTEEDRAKLINFDQELSYKIYTVQEFKGLEDKYIICYNIISSFESYWNDIVKSLPVAKRSSKHRFYFNLFYVAISRATNTLVIYEEGNIDAIKDTLFNSTQFKSIKELDTKDLNIIEDFGSQDWFEQALRYEKAEQYAMALTYYKNSKEPQTEISIKRCEIKSMIQSPADYISVANELMTISEYADAAIFFEKAGDFPNYVNSKVLGGSKVKSVLERIENKLSVSELMEVAAPQVFSEIKEHYNQTAKLLENLLV